MAKKDKKGDEPSGRTPSILNRSARHDYHILDSMEVGIVLKGSEVKSIRQGKVNLKDAFARVMKGELWLMGMHITPYANVNTFETLEPMRDRKLLLHRKQLVKLEEATAEKGLSLIPLKIYFKNRRAKLELGVGKGKKLYDKREDAKEKDAKREIDRAMKR